MVTDTKGGGKVSVVPMAVVLLLPTQCSTEMVLAQVTMTPTHCHT